MSTLTIVIAVGIVFLIFVFFLLSRNAKRNMNPIDSITFKGTMGLCRGDSYKFVLSRLKHLDVAVDANEDDINMLEMLGTGSIAIVKDYYALLHEVHFSFERKKLDSVLMKMNYSEYGMNEMFNILEARISRVLKMEPNYSSDDFVKWTSSDNFGAISLSIMKEDLVVMVLPN